MAYRCGDRYQMDLMPQSIEEYVSEDNPVRAYDAFVEAFDFRQLGIEINPDKVGNSEYDPLKHVQVAGLWIFLWCKEFKETGAGMLP